MCKIRIRFPFIPVSVTPILSKIAIPARLSARFVKRIMHRAAAINEIFLELNRADDKIITVRYCMNKRWLGRAIVSNQRKKSDLLLEKRSKREEKSCTIITRNISGTGCNFVCSQGTDRFLRGEKLIRNYGARIDPFGDGVTDNDASFACRHSC